MQFAMLLRAFSLASERPRWRVVVVAPLLVCQLSMVRLVRFLEFLSDSRSTTATVSAYFRPDGPSRSFSTWKLMGAGGGGGASSLSGQTVPAWSVTTWDPRPPRLDPLLP